MTERIKQIMTLENLSPSQFADKAMIQRSNLSHILNGRSRPTIDILMKILETFPYISTDWLMLGKGEMRKDSLSKPSQNTLFGENDQDTPINAPDLELTEPVNTPQTPSYRPASPDIDQIYPREPAATQQVVIKEVEVRKTVSRIMIIYSDNTIENFVPETQTPQKGR